MTVLGVAESFFRRSKWAATAAASSGIAVLELDVRAELEGEFGEVGVVRP